MCLPFENNFDLYCIPFVYLFYPFCVVLSVSFYTGAKARLYKIVILIDLIILIGFNLFFFHIVYAFQTELFRCLTFLL